jgi:polysaccharide biosynthesis protein PslH
MKILWLSHLLPYPPKGGVLQRSYHLLRQASKKHEVHLVALSQRALHPTADKVAESVAALSELCSSVKVFPNEYDSSRIRWAIMAAATYFEATSYDENWLWQPQLRDYIAEVMRSQKFDVVHVDTVGMLQYSDLLADTPIVLNHHNIESQLVQRRTEGEKNLLKRAYFAREWRKLEELERDFAPHVAMNVTVSDLDAERLQRIAGRISVHVVANGVDVDYFKPSTASIDRKGIVFVGSLYWYPNHEAVLFFLKEIWPKLRETNPDTVATIVGQGPPRELVDAAQDSRIRVPGFVDDVRPYIDDALLYICPIHTGGGTRLKILDALAMEKPLIATEMAVEGLSLVDGTHYLRAETGNDFVSQIALLEADPHLRQDIARAGRKLVEDRYSWDRIGGKLDAAYEMALAQSVSSIGKYKNESTVEI